MKILLLSDTHSYMDDAIINHCKQVDEVWHAGDFGNREVADKIKSVKSLQGVFGNIDGKDIRIEYPLDNRFTINDLDVWITHIGGYPGRYEARVRKVLDIHTPQLFICGHSHILKVMFDKNYNMLTMNPGAAGKYGFHKVRTMIRFEIHNGKIEKPEVIELGLRAALK
ncbi:MAG: metallophosphoesterase family protein [Fimbriimonadaceae bacterium]|nr:metallophosphoesterase family protein [Chitinophagales bacterium]